MTGKLTFTLLIKRVLRERRWHQSQNQSVQKWGAFSLHAGLIVGHLDWKILEVTSVASLGILKQKDHELLLSGTEFYYNQKACVFPNIVSLPHTQSWLLPYTGPMPPRHLTRVKLVRTSI